MFLLRTITLAVGASMLGLLPAVGAAAEEATDQQICVHFEDDWSPPERAAWTSICKTGEAVLRDAKSGGGPAGLPPLERSNLTLRPTFIRTILTKNPYREQIRAKGILIKGAIIAQPLLLNDLVVEGSLSFLNCEFAGPVDLRRSRFSLSVRFTGSNLTGGLEAAESIIDGSLVLGGTEGGQPSDAPTWTTIGFIHAQSARIAGNFDIRYAIVLTSDKARAENHPDVIPDINLTTAHIGGSIDIMHVTGREIRLPASEVHGQLVIVDCTLVPTPQQQHVEGRLYALLNLNFVQVTQDVFLNRTIAIGRVDIQGAEIGGGLNLQGGMFFESMIARGATIKGALRVGYNERPNQQGKTTYWSSAASLDLTNANIGIISTQLDVDYWPNTMKLANAKLGGFDFSLRDAADRSAEDKADWFKKWLGRQDGILPYYQVRTVLAAMGDDATAAQVGYAGRDRELSESIQSWHLLNAVYLFFSKILVGYGYCMWLPLVETVAIIAIGAFAFMLSREGKNEAPLRFDALVYSIDMFLPVLEFRKHHRDIDMTSNARFYFYFHKLAGWIISSFLIAGLAGFTK